MRDRPSLDAGTGLIALGATAEVLGPKGRRTVELAKFFQAPANTNEREHTLAANEMLAFGDHPGARPGQRQLRSSPAPGDDWPLVQAAVAWAVNGGKTVDAKVVLGHVAPTPHVAEAAARPSMASRSTKPPRRPPAVPPPKAPSR